eukprot:998008-Rhodomonas_salina.3
MSAKSTSASNVALGGTCTLASPSAPYAYSLAIVIVTFEPFFTFFSPWRSPASGSSESRYRFGSSPPPYPAQIGTVVRSQGQVRTRAWGCSPISLSTRYAVSSTGLA